MASCCLKLKGPENNKFWGSVVKAVGYLGYPSNIQPRTLALCSEGFSAQGVLTEYFFDCNRRKEFLIQEKKHKVVLAE